jgi:hypothetical protein
MHIFPPDAGVQEKSLSVTKHRIRTWDNRMWNPRSYRLSHPQRLLTFFTWNDTVYFMKPFSLFLAYNSVYNNAAASGSYGPLLSARCRMPFELLTLKEIRQMFHPWGLYLCDGQHTHEWQNKYLRRTSYPKRATESFRFLREKVTRWQNDCLKVTGGQGEQTSKRIKFIYYNGAHAMSAQNSEKFHITTFHDRIKIYQYSFQSGRQRGFIFGHLLNYFLIAPVIGPNSYVNRLFLYFSGQTGSQLRGKGPFVQKKRTPTFMASLT